MSGMLQNFMVIVMKSCAVAGAECMHCQIRSYTYLEGPLLGTYAAFTLGLNKFSLITNETCFIMKSVHLKCDTMPES